MSTGHQKELSVMLAQTLLKLSKKYHLKKQQNFDGKHHETSSATKSHKKPSTKASKFHQGYQNFRKNIINFEKISKFKRN